MKKKILITVLFIVMYFILSQNVSYAGYQRWNSLNYDVTLDRFGDARIVETWDIDVSETNTLFKNFYLDTSKYSDITDVSVKDLTTGIEFSEIYKEMYHVTKNCFYALPISGNKFEIAWGVGLDNSSATKKYQISYTVKDAVRVYNDCSEFYWMFLGTDNSIPADEVTGTIRIPEKVSDLEKFRVWAHGPLNGEILKESKDVAIIKVDNFNSETMLEVRIVVEEPMFEFAENIFITNKLDRIISEETEFANQANIERRKSTMIGVGIILVFGIMHLIFFIIFFKKIMKYNKELKRVSNMPNYNVDIGEYFRDIPREEETTPTEAAFLYYSKKNTFNMTNQLSNVFAGLILHLCLKGYIVFDKNQNNDIEIQLLDKETDNLKGDEKSIFMLLKEVKEYNDLDVITIKDLNRYAKNKYDDFYARIADLEDFAKEEHIKNGNYDEYIAKDVEKYNSNAILYVFGVIFGLPFVGLLTIVEFIICFILLRKTLKKLRILSEQGEAERQMWKGLKKYMEDFSLLEDKEVPDLILWEKYLVYATTFGISGKVIKQLKVVYPEFTDINNSNYTYMYMMSRSNFGDNFITDLNKGMTGVYSAYQTAYNTAHSSSSGGGGGFSSGGGGRRRRWPVAVEDK